jgi:pantoate--beta-alanine ligase
MLIIKKKKELDSQLDKARQKGLSIGFVPTMGALHEGHLSLIRQSKRASKLTVCSIFVNPTQFNDPADFEKYPATIEADIQLLLSVKCDVLFLPSVDEMYPDGTKLADPIDFGFLAETLEGEFRPGHFDGMAHIVAQLLLAVKPDFLYMGQKDYQQAMIVQAMIKHRQLKVALVVCAIKREADGLAMSSRNVRLDTASRLTAVTLSKCLKKMKSAIQKNSAIDSATLIKLGESILSKESAFKVEYIAWRDATDLSEFDSLSPHQSSVLLVAAWIGGVRLIDNMVV